MRPRSGLREQLKNVPLLPENPTHDFHIDLSDLPEEPVAIDVRVVDAVTKLKIEQDMMAAQLRAEERLMRPVHWSELAV